MLHALECRLGSNNVSLAEHTKRKHNVQVPVQFTVEVVVVRKYKNLKKGTRIYRQSVNSN